MALCRVRFEIPYSQKDIVGKATDGCYYPDTRPIAWPTPYPCWLSGSGFEFDVWVAIAPIDNTIEYIQSYWPEFNGKFSFKDPIDKIESTDRFPIAADVYDANGFAMRPALTANEGPDFKMKFD